MFGFINAIENLIIEVDFSIKTAVSDIGYVLKTGDVEELNITKEIIKDSLEDPVKEVKKYVDDINKYIR